MSLTSHSVACRVARGRAYKAVLAAAKAPKPGHTVSVMTYNILAQKYAVSGWHSYCPPQHLQWESRRARLLEEIESCGSDIICLQEVEAPVFTADLQPWLARRGYRGHYLARQYGEQVQGPAEGVALFYRTELFELLHHHAFVFSKVDTDPPAPLAPALSSTDADELAAAAGAVPTRSASSDEEDAVVGAGTSARGGASVSAKRRRNERSSGGGAGSGDAPDRTASHGQASTSGRSSSSGGGGGGSGASGGGRGNNEFWSVFGRRQEGAILALLCHKPSRREVLAAGTHLFWNPAFPDVKAFQAAVLCREMSAFLHRHADAPPERVPVVLAGDFNSLSRKCVTDCFDTKLPSEGLVSGVVTLLTRGSLPPEHPDHPATRRRPGESGKPDFRGLALHSAGLSLASAYQLACGSDPPLTTRTATFAGCVDYIFVSPEHFEVTQTLEMPYTTAAATAAAAVTVEVGGGGAAGPRSSGRDSGGSSGRSGNGNGRGGSRFVRSPPTEVAFAPIPNDVYPSDHLSLAAVLRIRS